MYNRSSHSVTDPEGVKSDSSVAQGLRAEIADIFENYFRVIFNYCAYRLFRRDLAEEATCEVFLQFVRKYPSFREGPITPKNRIRIRNWLYGTASNVVVRYMRDSSRFDKIATELARMKEKYLVESSSETNESDWPALYNAIGKLKIEDQEIITLRYFEGLGTSEIAQIMGRNHSSVRVRLLRVVKKLRLTIGESFAE